MTQNSRTTKVCEYCGTQIPAQAAVCPSCGGIVEASEEEQPRVGAYTNTVNPDLNTNSATGSYGRPFNKWVAFFLCLFLGCFGAHKFYEGKTGMGVLYLFTAGLFIIGWLVDLIRILTKPNPYYIEGR